MRHYEGKSGAFEGVLGVFDYDEDVWEVEVGAYYEQDALHLKKGYKGEISLPKGVKSCYNMFHDSDLTGCWFEDFDTSNVEDMAEMFSHCKIPEGFSLGDRFDTSNVKDMSRMFAYCKIPKGFSLGDKFNTSNVIDMRDMFVFCKMSEGFSLGDKFNTSNVEFMNDMFSNCEMPEGFSLGDKFDTSNVRFMDRMFEECKMPEGFSLGDKFNTSDAINIFGKPNTETKKTEVSDVGNSTRRTRSEKTQTRKISLTELYPFKIKDTFARSDTGFDKVQLQEVLQKISDEYGLILYEGEYYYYNYTSDLEIDPDFDPEVTLSIIKKIPLSVQALESTEIDESICWDEDCDEDCDEDYDEDYDKDRNRHAFVRFNKKDKCFEICVIQEVPDEGDIIYNKWYLD